MQWLVGLFCFVFPLHFPPPFGNHRKLGEVQKACVLQWEFLQWDLLRYVTREFRKPTASLLFMCNGAHSLQFRGRSMLVVLHTDKGSNKGKTIHLWLLRCFLIKISSIGHNKISIPPIHQNNTQHPEWGFCWWFLRNDNTRSLEGSSSSNKASNFS